MCPESGLAKVTRYRVPDSVVAEQVNGETVLLGMESGLYFGLDTVGSRIWRSLGDGKSLGEVVADLQQRFPEQDPKSLRADADALLDELLSHALLSPCN